jgi:predicted ATP-dependent endonuclease of OLD family
MRLHSVEIANYRSIKDLTIDFTDNCLILVGVNESGKSNILKALSLLGDSIPLDGDVRIPLVDDDPSVESIVDFVFEMESVDIDRIINNLTTKFINSENEKVVLIDLKTREEYLLKQYMLEFSTKGLFRVNIKNRTKDVLYYRKPDFALKDWKAINKNIAEDVNLMIANKKYNLRAYDFISQTDARNVNPQYVIDVVPEQIGKMIGKEIMDTVSKNLPVCIFWHYDEKNILPSEINIAEFANNPDCCLPLKNMFNLFGKEKIFEELKESQKNRQMLMSLLKNVAKKTTIFFQETWRDYDKIEFDLQPDGDKMLILIKEQNYFSLAQRSDGFKRFISFLLLISASVAKEKIKNAVLLIDEPDIGLHPKGAKLLKEELFKIARTNRVVYSTHSVYMIDKEKLSRNLICTKENETTRINIASTVTMMED